MVMLSIYSQADTLQHEDCFISVLFKLLILQLVSEGCVTDRPLLADMVRL